jgi:hypothetical protein
MPYKDGFVYQAFEKAQLILIENKSSNHTVSNLRSKQCLN